MGNGHFFEPAKIHEVFGFYKLLDDIFLIFTVDALGNPGIFT